MTEGNYVHYRGVLWHYFILFIYLFIFFFFCVEMFMNILLFNEAFAHAKRAQRIPIAIENEDQSMPENLVMTSAYVVRRPYRL